MSIRLPERVGLANAKDMMFTARRIDGTRAKEIGLVDQAPPDDELDAVVATLAGEICANSAGTNRRVKLLLRERFERNRPEAILYERSSPARRRRGHGRADAAPAQVGPEPIGSFTRGLAQLTLFRTRMRIRAVLALYDDGRGRRRRSC